ncbi:MAG: hypothetical protein ACYCVY_01880 [Acidiferrobacteraceae bacterium]
MRSYRVLAVTCGVLFGLWSLQAQAVPSFARQTGMPCEVCHTVFPELTPFGRLFKLNGYTLTGLPQIEAGQGKALKINASPPLSAAIQVALSHENKRPPAYQNNNVEFPRQMSLFYAGEISPHMGAFMQWTYEQRSAGSSFQWDNTDIRYANHFTLWGQDQLYGLTLNNNPSVEDVWNDTPAWGYPWIHSGEEPYDRVVNGAPAAPSLMLDNLGQNVAGLGAYTLLDNEWYADVSFYRTAIQGNLMEPVGAGGGALAGTLDSINGVAPYWRLAWQHQFDDSYLEIGTLGMQTQGLDILHNSDTYTDIGVDSQYELPVRADLLAVHVLYLEEHQAYGATAANGAIPVNSNDHLADAHIDGVWHFRHMAETAIAYDRWSGTNDTGLYAWSNNPEGSPDTDYWTAEVAYLPWENTKFGVQYRMYTRYVGSTVNVSNDNYTFLYAWLVW